MRATFAVLAVLLVSAAWVPSASAKHGADDRVHPEDHGVSPASPKSPVSPASPKKPAAPLVCKPGSFKCGGKCYKPAFFAKVVCAKGVFSFTCKRTHLKCGATCCPTAPAGAKAVCKVYPSRKKECEFECKEGWRKCSKLKKCCKKPCKC